MEASDLQKLSDGDLFELLEAVSEEVKRRNGLLGRPASPEAKAEVGSQLGSLLEVLAKGAASSVK